MAWIGAGCASTTTASRPTTTRPVTSTVPTTTTTAGIVDPPEAPSPSAAGALPPPAATSLKDASSPSCRSGNPLANVYHPSRLHVIRACIVVTGTVVDIRSEDDGDVHININLDPPFAGLVNDRNTSGEQGALVVEIVPADEPGCTPGQPARSPPGTYDYGICTGANEIVPAEGAHVAVTGPYVLDTAHGWMEVHPAWAITGTAAAGTLATAPPSQPPASQLPPLTTQATALVNVVTPGAYCSPPGVTGVSSGGVPMTCSSQSCLGVSYGGVDRWRKTTC